MNKSKKIFIITITFLMLVGLTTITATDIDNNDTTTITQTSQTNTIDTTTQTKTINKDTTGTKEAPTSQTENIQENTDSQEIINNKNGEKTQNLKTSRDVIVNNYTDLKNYLTNNTYDTVTVYIGDNILLAGNIIVNNAIKNLTINGNGKTINGDGQWQFLSIQSGSVVNINNITITNCKANYGGAIDATNSNITINNTNLTHNNATYNGGAIHGYISNITVTNTNLTHNTARTLGGAIYGNTNSTITVTNSNLTHNTAGTMGGAIYGNTNSTITVTNSNLNKNTATNSAGGAIYGYTNSTITITQSNITHNNATYNGGAIDATNSNITINNTNLTNNTARTLGGAIFSSCSNITITQTNITHNNAYRGGAIYGYINSTITITQSNLTHNNATYGGAIHGSDNITITNSNLTHNTGGYGGAIYTYNNTINITNSTLTHNNATYGGAIHGSDYNNLTITQSNLTHNNATYNGGAINANESSNITINNTNITHNNASWGGAIYGYTNNNITVQNSNLKNNNVSGMTRNGVGGAIYGGDYSNITIQNSNLTHNNANAIERWNGYGGAIFVRTRSNLTINNTQITHNNAQNSGGAIYGDTQNNITVQNSNLTHNNANLSGGAIRNTGGNWGTTTITNSNLIHNNANGTERYYGGGAIYSTGNMTINNTNFTHNNAGSGGAIQIQGSSNITINNTNFTDNYVIANTGYVIDFSTANDIIITDNTFINNTDNTRDMLFSDAKTGANVDIRDNIYINNYLNDTIITPQTSVITDNQNRVLSYEIPVDLREIYNDMVHNGTLRVYVNGVYSNAYSVKDGKTNISIRNSELTSRVNEILLNYTGINSNNKHYANNTATFNIIKEVNTTLSVEAPDMVYSEDVALINITLVDVNGTPLSGEIIDVFVDGVEVSNLITNGDGKAVYPFSVSGDKTSHITIAHHTGNNSMYTSTHDVSKGILVQKIEPELYVTANLTAHHESNITIQMVDHEGNPIANKNLTVKISEEGKDDIISTVTTNNMGLAVYNFTPVDDGVLWINVTYPGDTRYNGYSEVFEFNRSSVITNLEITATTTKINMTNSITVEVFAVNNAKVNGTVELDIDGEKYNLTITNGIGVYTDYKSTVAGSKHVKANITNISAGYGHSFAENDFNVEKLPTIVNITTVNRTAGNVAVKVTVKPEDNIDSVVDGGNIIIQTVNGNTRTTIYNGTLSNGELIYLTDINESGWTDFATEYFGNDYFDGEENNTGLIEILKVNTITSTFDKTARVGDKIILNATVTDVDGNPVNDGSIIFHIGENQVEAKVKNGMATVDYTLPVTYTKGNYTIKANYTGTNKYNISAGEAKLSIELQETSMNISILNDTKANTTIEVTLNSSTDDNKPISGADIVIKDLDGNIIGGSKTNDNGTAVITIDIPTGENNITISYPGDDINSPLEETLHFNVTPRESKTNVTIINDTVGNVTIDVEVLDPVTGEPATGQVNIIVDNETVKTVDLDEEGKATIPVDIDKKGNHTITVEYEGNDDYNGSTYTLNNTYIPGKDPKVTIIIDNQIVDNTTINVTITDPETGEPISNATFNVTLPNGTNVTGTTDENGTAIITFELPPGDNNITIKYPGDDNHEDKEENIIIKVKSPTTITVDPVTGVVLDNVTFTAHVVDYQDNPVNGGYVVFKVGGKTLTYANGTTIRTSVLNGIAQLSYTAEEGWIVDSHPNLNVQATYSGTSMALQGRSENSKVTIYKRNATVTVTAPDDYVNGTLHIDAVVKDQNGSLINDGNLVFKLNGLSLKDENNKGIIAKVVNGKVHLDVKLPFAYSAKKYNLTAIYSHKIYNKATGINTTTLKAIPTYINAIVSLSDQYSKPVITGQIYNKNNNAILQGTAILNIKFDGISYAKKVVVNNGTFRETLDGISLYKPGTHKVEVTVGANSHYEGLRETYTTQATAKYNATPIITSITRNKTTTRIQAKIVDDRNKNAQKDLKITIKVNGLSFLVNQTVRNGKVDVVVDTSTLKNRTYNLELVSGANTYYNAGKATTELPKY